ncbi:MAG: pyridoxamine 5'-phosphate oxidase family protein [Pseudomonadota bacterium]
MTLAPNPFHVGELEAQERAGVGDVASRVAGFIRDFMPQQHRDFYASLPFLVVSSGDEAGRVWITLLEGPDGFIRSPDQETLTLGTELDPLDPLAPTLQAGSDIGVVGIELATRRRNRLSGTLSPNGNGFTLDVRQTFGNCPQYIHEREWHRVANPNEKSALRSDHLTAEHIARIGAADTLFIGTGYQGEADARSTGYDASHRGGEPGFVNIVDRNRLRIPDYAGNNFFNTIGNLLSNPRVGLVFVDFGTGGLLHVTGRAEIDWEPDPAREPGARRAIEVTIETVVDRPSALSLRWDTDGSAVRSLTVSRKESEAEGITSFYLSSKDGRPLPTFEAGQHLPIELEVPGQTGKVRRSYSLSGSPGAEGYRLSIKREPDGIASRHMHDVVKEGDVIDARRPSGDFVVTCNQCPLVLASAGIGLTPMLSMLHATAGDSDDRPIWFVHGARNGSQHALRDEVDGLVKDRPRVSKQVIYSRPNNEDRLGHDYDSVGHVTAETLLGLKAGPNAHYMLCGPAAFIADIQSGLEAAGVPADQIHFETFGPAG